MASVIKKRTIQHPGFEFFETDMSIYKEYVQNTDALIVGYFARGPINQPVQLSNLNDYTKYFGTPESEAEIYFYQGISSVIDAGGTVTAVRLPYDNTTSSVSAEGTAVKYRAMVGTLVDVEIKEKAFADENKKVSKIGDFSDLSSAYKGGTKFKNISFESTVVTEDELTDIVGGNSLKDFIITNRYNDYLTERGNEIFVSVIGAANVIREQGLDVEVDNADGLFECEVDENGKFKDFVLDELGNKIPYSKTSLNVYKRLENGDTSILNPDNNQGLLFSRERLKWQNNGQITADGRLLSVADSFEDGLLQWFPTIQTYFDTDNGSERQFIDPKKDDFITVIVSRIKPSSVESGKFNIEILETFSGSIFKGSLDPISNESNYIGDDINENSNFISFYGKQKYKNYDKEEDVILIQNLDPVRLSWADGAAYNSMGAEFLADYKSKVEEIDANIASVNELLDAAVYAGDADAEAQYRKELEELGVERSNLFKQKEIYKTSLKKVFVKVSGAGQFDYVDSVIAPALKKVRNNIMYLYRDVYDCGLSSIVAYMTSADANDVDDGRAENPGDVIYKPEKTNPAETSSASFLNAATWKRVLLAFARHCQYNHKLSMFHADGPRKLVLNGNLSRDGDLHQDQLDVIFTAKKTQVVSIKDNTYVETNTQWYEALDTINKSMVWFPHSTKLAYDITWNDIHSNVWDAPAGHRYGVINGVKRPAFNPEYDTMDRLYLNCLNYATLWPDGVLTTEGQKTGYSENSALNRINVRRLMIYLERYTQTVACSFIYEPNTESVRSQLVSALEGEYKRVLTLGGLYNYRIVCDTTNNSAEVIDRNELRLTIMVQPTKTIEFILGNFIITKTGANLEEISPVF